MRIDFLTISTPLGQYKAKFEQPYFFIFKNIECNYYNHNVTKKTIRENVTNLRSHNDSVSELSTKHRFHVHLKKKKHRMVFG